LQDYLIPYSLNDYDFKKVLPQIKIVSKDVSNNIATIETVLKTNIYWNASNALGKPINRIKSERLNLY